MTVRTKTKQSQYTMRKTLEVPTTNFCEITQIADIYGWVSASITNAKQSFGAWSYLSLADRDYNVTSKITYESQPRKVNGITPWNRCTHVRVGFDRLAYFQQSPWCLDVTSGRTAKPSVGEDPPLVLEHKVNGVVTPYPFWPDRNVHYRCHLLNSGGSLWNPLSVTDSTSVPPLTADEVMDLTVDDLVSSLFPGASGDVSDYITRNSSYHSRMSDLNELLHKESLIYSNILQAVPLVKLLRLGKSVQFGAQWLSQWRSRFGKRPFSTVLATLSSVDLINRFVIQTTMNDIQDFMSSFSDVWRVFETGQSRNGMDWTRMAHRPPPMTYSSSWTIHEDLVHLFARRPLPATGIDESYYRLELSDWSSTGPTDENVVDGIVGNDQFSWFGYKQIEDLIHSALKQSLENSSTIKYRTGHGFTFQRSFLRWVKVRYKNLGALSPLKVWANRVGITKPLDSLWDLIPFSFVCDYFFRIGDWIEGISNHFADFKELRGDIIAAQPLWLCDRYEVGSLAQTLNYHPEVLKSSIASAVNRPDKVVIAAPKEITCQPWISRFSRYPSGGGEVSSRLGFLSDKDLSPVRKRTLAELALLQIEKRNEQATRASERMSGAVTMLKLESREWRKNKILSDWSVDQFDDYLHRTLKQAAKAVKAVR